MAQRERVISVVLMASSILLLTALQFFWLKNSYEKAYFDLRRETSSLLMNTIFGLRDSLFVKNIETITDSTERPLPRILKNDTTTIKYHSVDSLRVGSKMQVYISTDVVDSTANFLKPLASSIHKLGPRRSFVIRMGPDTLSRDTIALLFKKELNASGIHQPFRINVFREHDTFRKSIGFPEPFENGQQQPLSDPFSNVLITERVHLNPLHGYTAIFSGIPNAILKEIAPQILFSFLLTTATIAAFVVMYRSLLSQRRLNEVKNHFISNVTHELKTPVATVSVALEALKDFNILNDPEKSKEYLSIAQEELNRLTLMTDKILKATSYEQQGITFMHEKVNVVEVVGKVLSSLKLMFDKHNIKLRYSTEGSGFEMEGSTQHLTNVVYNLVENAIKYGRDNPEIGVHVHDRSDSIEFTVRDNGIGIGREYQKKIFEKFFRVPTGDIHNVKGYGLGLNYVMEVVRKHSGKIDVDSELGKGSSFTVRLPKKIDKDLR